MLLQILESGAGADLGVFAFTLGGEPVAAGQTSDAVSFEVWNDHGNPSADLVPGIQLLVTGYRAGQTSPDPTIAPLAQRWLQVRIVGAVNCDPQLTAWRQFAPDAPFLLEALPGNAGRQLEIRIVVPPTGGSASAYTFWLAVAGAATVSPAAGGLPYAGLRGIVEGYGDRSMTRLLYGGAVAAQGSPSTSVDVAEVSGLFSGWPAVALAGPLALDDTASDGATGAGESYLAVVALEASGVTVTKGTKGTSPRSVSARPAPPVGSLPLAWLEKRHADNIETADVTDARSFWGLQLVNVNGFGAVLSPGWCVAGDWLVRFEGAQPLSFTPSATSRVWIAPPDLIVVSADPPADDRAVLLFEVIADGSSITSVSDLRPIVGARRRALRFAFPAPAADAVQACAYAGSSPGLVVQPAGALARGGVRAFLADPGAGTAGSTVFDLERWTGSAWVTLFTSSGSIDRRPTIAHGGAVLAYGLPEVLEIPPGALIRAKIVSIPSGGAAPTGAAVLLLLEES